MGIKIRNLHHWLCEFRYSHTLTATTDADMSCIPFSGFITQIGAACSTTGGGANDDIIDINVNGTTIFANATKLTIDATTGAISVSPLATEPYPVNVGDIITMDIDQIDAAPINLAVEVMISRTPSASDTGLPDDAM